MMNDRRMPAGNSTYPKVSVQWLNDPESYRDCYSLKVTDWLTMTCFEICQLLVATKRYAAA
jgi:hypothetical protein